MFFALILLQSVFAGGPPGSKLSAAGHDCVFYVGPKADIGYNHINVECHWPEVTVAQVDPVLSKWGIHDQIFSAVKVSDVIGQEGEYDLVRQVHTAKGIKPREAILKYKRQIVNGGYKYAWFMHENQPPASPGKVVSTYDDGHFIVTHNPSGGVKVEYHLLYSPSGKIPKFVVNWFQTDGVMTVMKDLRTYLNR